MPQTAEQKFNTFKSFSDFKSIPQPRGENADLANIVGSRWWLGHRVHGERKHWAYGVIAAANLSDGLRADPDFAELVAFILAVESPQAFAKGRRAARRVKQSMNVQ